MAQLALHFIGGSQHFHTPCKTHRDAPDAVQLLTPCTAGNGRLHILELGRLAVTLFRYPEGKAYVSILRSQKAPAGPISGNGIPKGVSRRKRTGKAGI